MGDFSHLDETGKASMVDVTPKSITKRQARVVGYVNVSTKCCESLNSSAITEIIHTARIAGIFATKKTSELIPLCHQLNLTKAQIDIEFAKGSKQFVISCTTKVNGNTGVEMESFTGAQIAALTIYDMIKAINPQASIGPFTLIEKTGGKSNLWKNKNV